MVVFEVSTFTINSSQMSNESSVSETTPLRRPASQSSDDYITPLSSVVHNSNTVDNNNISETSVPRNRQNANTNNTNIGSSQANATAIDTVAISTKHSTNNNNVIEIRLNNNNISNNNNNNSNNHNNANNNNNSSTHKMDTNKRILLRVGLDVFILLCVGAPILGFFLWGNSYKRGFFCDDESLMHPFKDSTVKSWMLYIIGLVIPIGAILIVEVLRFQHGGKSSSGNGMQRRYVFMNYEIPEWMMECYKKIGVFGFGAAVSQLVTDVSKYTIGRLRPHFFAVCQPIMDDGTTCTDRINAGKYIQDFRCQGVGSTERMLKEVRLSFPSGHSSFTFFTMVYLALYLQSRMTWRGSKLLRHLLQFIFILIAWYTALSRVSDYKHHWSDVLAGSTIGALCAVVVAKYVSDLFQDKSSHSYELPRTRQDATTMSPQTITTTNGGGH